MYEKQTWTNGEVITQEKLNHMEDGIANSGLRLVEVQLTVTNSGSTTNCELTNARELANLLKSGYRDVYNTVLCYTEISGGLPYSYSLSAGLRNSAVAYVDYSGIVTISTSLYDSGTYVINNDGNTYQFSDSDIDENGVARWSQSGGSPDIG